MEFLFCVFSSNPCILCANPYLNDIDPRLRINQLSFSDFKESVPAYFTAKPTFIRIQR